MKNLGILKAFEAATGEYHNPIKLVFICEDQIVISPEALTPKGLAKKGFNSFTSPNGDLVVVNGPIFSYSDEMWQESNKGWCWGDLTDSKYFTNCLPPRYEATIDYSDLVGYRPIEKCDPAEEKKFRIYFM